MNSYIFPSLKRGELNLGPQGLGFLLSNGYIGDARVFYCASAGGTMPMPAFAGSIPGAGRTRAATGLAALRRAGGFEARSIMYGDWSWLGVWEASYTGMRAVLGDYNYRNTPAVLAADSGKWGITGHWSEPWSADKLDGNILVRGTRPFVRTSVGTPIFKTQKMLAGRAIVADSFSRATLGKAVMRDDIPPGDGLHAHRDGYNVLYGDWHATWHGDPQQRFIWADDAYNDLPAGAGIAYDNWCFNGLSGSQSYIGWWWYRKQGGTFAFDNRTYDYYDIENCTTKLWHTFDSDTGIDVDAD